MALTNFGQIFADKTLRRFYATAVFPAITNSDYVGEIKKAGDRVDILSFPGNFLLEDYASGTDMTTIRPTDAQDQLVVEKRKSHNFSLDKLEDLFTYANDVPDSLVENVAKTVERTIDSYVLGKVEDVGAGNWIGIDVRVAGATGTHASLATTAAGATLNCEAQNYATAGNVGWVEIGDGTLVHAGFQDPEDLGKPIRLTSGTTWATDWYYISAVTDTNTCTIKNWDDSVAAPDIPNGDILRGLYGGADFTSDSNGDGKPTTEGSATAAGWGWEFQAGRATSLTTSNIYEVIVQAAEFLDRAEIPDTDRVITLPPQAVSLLKSASELQPAIEMAYSNIVLNGKIARVAGFDVHQAAGIRVTTRLEKSTLSSDRAETAGERAFQILANHKSYCTFAYKWKESRVVDAENQFAKKYQSLHLFGAKVPSIRRKAGVAILAKI